MSNSKSKNKALEDMLKYMPTFVIDERGATRVTADNFAAEKAKASGQYPKDPEYNKHTFSYPSKEFKDFEQMESVFSADEWNTANQEKRNKMVLPICKKFIKKYPNIDWEDFFFELTDNNYHTERAIFEDLIKDKKQGKVR